MKYTQDRFLMTSDARQEKGKMYLAILSTHPESDVKIVFQSACESDITCRLQAWAAEVPRGRSHNGPTQCTLHVHLV